MTYNPGIPLPKDKFNASQDQMLINFQTLYTAFSANHIPLDAVSGAGNHTVIQLAEQEQSSQFQTNAGEISIYAKDVEGQTDQIFMRYQGNQKEFQVTNYQIYAIPPIMNGNTLVQSTYISFLPGNILVYFGEVNSSSVVKLIPAVCNNIVCALTCLKVASGLVGGSANLSLIMNGEVFSELLLLTQPAPGPFSWYYLVVGNIK